MDDDWTWDGIDLITGEQYSWEEQDFNYRMSSGRWGKTEAAGVQLEGSPVAEEAGKTEARECQPAKRARASPTGSLFRTPPDDEDVSPIRSSEMSEDMDRGTAVSHPAPVCSHSSSAGPKTHSFEVDRSAANKAIFAAVKRADVCAYEAALFDGADVCALLEDGQSLLHVAAANESPEITRRLILLGMEVHTGSPYNSTALHVAAGKGGQEVVEELIYWKASVNALDSGGQTPLVRAVMNEKKENVVALLAAGASQRRCLELSVKYWSTEMLRGLIQETTVLLDFDLEDEDGLTPLMQAASWGDGMEGTRKIHTILDACCQIDQVSTKTKQTALQIACERGHERNVYHLLARGASVANRDARGLSALDVARMHRGHCWNCAGYIRAVLTAPSTGAEEGVALYASEAMAAWEAPFELRRNHLPRETVRAIRAWAILARGDAKACYLFLGGPASRRAAWCTERNGQVRKGTLSWRVVGGTKEGKKYAGCVAEYLVYGRQIRMNIADVFTPVYRSGEPCLF